MNLVRVDKTKVVLRLRCSIWLHWTACDQVLYGWICVASVKVYLFWLHLVAHVCARFYIECMQLGFYRKLWLKNHKLLNTFGPSLD